MYSNKDLPLTEVYHFLCQTSIARLSSLLQRVDKGAILKFPTDALRMPSCAGARSRRKHIPNASSSKLQPDYRMAADSFTVKSAGTAFLKKVVASKEHVLNTSENAINGMG